jgi:hypothetical protein
MTRSARFVGLVRDSENVGARIEYTRPEGGSSAIVFYDTESLNGHIATLEKEWRDTAEERAALSALITEAGKKK